MISLSKLQARTSTSNNINTHVNVSVGEASHASPPITEPTPGHACDPYTQKSVYEACVKYPPDISCKRCEVLSIIIDMQRNNPLIHHGYIVADDVKLMRFVQLLTDADDVQLDADTLAQGCFTKKVYRKVHAIYVIKREPSGGPSGTPMVVTKTLKYDYPQVMKELKELGISTKYVW